MKKLDFDKKMEDRFALIEAAVFGSLMGVSYPNPKAVSRELLQKVSSMIRKDVEYIAGRAVRNHITSISR